MPIPVTDYISTTDPSDTYATHNSGTGRGGLHEVADPAARDAITAARRVEGMLAYVQSTGTYYTLQSDLVTWVVFSGGGGGASTILTLEAGEDLAVGDPVWVNTNKFYIADNVTNFRVIGIVTTAALTGLSATATIAGQITLSGLTPNSPYFLGSGIITATASVSGYVVRMGQAVSSTTLLLNIEEPILLSS